MLKICEASYNNGNVIIENLNIPNNSKIYIIWDSDGNINNSIYFNQNKLPKGILFNKNERVYDKLESLPIDAVNFQRELRDDEWN